MFYYSKITTKSTCVHEDLVGRGEEEEKEKEMKKIKKSKVGGGEGEKWQKGGQRPSEPERKQQGGINGRVPDRCCPWGHYRPLCVFGTG